MTELRADRTTMAGGALLLAALTLAARQGGWPAAGLLLLALVAAYAAARRAAAPEDARFLVFVVVFSLLARDVAAGALDVVLTARSPYGPLFYDDNAYVAVAMQMAAFWRGEPIGFPTDPSITNSYVAGMGALFTLVGLNVVSVRLINGLFITLAAILTYRTMLNLGLAGRRWGLLGILFFPSLTLWSLLALKDTYVVTSMVVAVWGASELARTKGYLWLLPTALALVALDGARKYAFLLLAISWPVALVLTVPPPRRWVASALAAAVAAGMIIGSNVLGSYGIDAFARLGTLRAAMAKDARSALVEPLPVVKADPGDRFVIAAAGRTPDPVRLPQTFVVPAGARVVLADPDSPPLTTAPGAAPTPAPSGFAQSGAPVVVQVGDMVVIGGTCVACAVKTGEPQPLFLTPGAHNVFQVAAPPSTADGSVQQGLVDSLRYLPTGLLSFLTAPFPLTARSMGELAATPEMLAWYAVLALACIGLYRFARERNLRYAYGILALGGMALVLSLAEGNAGTLVRHRAMAIIFVVVLAAVGLQDLLVRYRGRRTAAAAVRRAA